MKTFTFSILALVVATSAAPLDPAANITEPYKTLSKRDSTPDQNGATDGADLQGLNGGFCGNFASANSFDAQTNINNLQANGQTCTAAAGSCYRVGCINTSGVYLCAGPDSEFSIGCDKVGNTARDNVMPTCVSGEAPMSGQVFDIFGNNVIVAFANCNDSPDTLPSSYAQPGPNGIPHSVITFSNDGVNGLPPGVVS